MTHARIAALVVLTACATPAFAQTQTRTTLLDTDRRQGTTVSGSIALPTNASLIMIEIPIPTRDYEDVENTLCFTLRYFVPAEQDWRTHGRSCWHGGRTVNRQGEVNAPPREFLTPAEWGGREIRVEIDHLQEMRAGVELVTE